jgi:hypothetical protein
MEIHVKILGQRRGVTKCKRSDGVEGFIRGSVGTPGQPLKINELAVRGRNDPNFSQLKEEFHRV